MYNHGIFGHYYLNAFEFLLLRQFILSMATNLGSVYGRYVFDKN